MRISDYLDSRQIVFLDVDTREQAIETLVDILEKERRLEKKDVFLKAIVAREKIVSTGIGMGVAIPHAKLKEFTHFFIAIGIQKKKGIEWDSLDKAPVRLIFMIGGPDNSQDEYLQILSLLTSVIRDVDLRKKILNAQTAEEVFDLFNPKTMG